MSVRPFAGSATILELECTGRALTSNADLLSLALYRQRGSDEDVMVSVNLRTGHCTTSHIYAACVISPFDVMATRVVVLITDLEEEESRNFGCKVTSLGQVGLPSITTWVLTVTALRE